MNKMILSFASHLNKYVISSPSIVSKNAQPWQSWPWLHILEM